MYIIMPNISICFHELLGLEWWLVALAASILISVVDVLSLPISNGSLLPMYG